MNVFYLFIGAAFLFFGLAAWQQRAWFRLAWLTWRDVRTCERAALEFELYGRRRGRSNDKAMLDNVSPRLPMERVIKSAALSCIICKAPMDWTEDKRAWVQSQIAESEPGENLRFNATCPMCVSMEKAEMEAQKRLIDVGDFFE